jgi:hypothetical protein
MSASLKRRLLAAVCSASFASFAVGPAVTEADTPQPVIWCAANLGSDTESTSDSVIATTLREMRSSASPASDSVVFTLDMRRPGPEISIVETRDGGGPRQLYLRCANPIAAMPRSLPSARYQNVRVAPTRTSPW